MRSAIKDYPYLPPYQLSCTTNSQLGQFMQAAFCGVSSLRASRGRMGCEKGYGIIPPFPTHGSNITGDVLVSGIFAVSVLIPQHL